MTLFNILFFGFMSAVLGGLFTNIKGENAVPRFVSLFAMFIVLSLQFYTEPVLLVAYAWCFWCFRLLPTQSLFSAVNGKAPTRDDSKLWDWLQNLAAMIAAGFHPWTNGEVNAYVFGIIYGFLRASLAIPAIIAIGNWWLLLFLLTGFAYYAAGWYGRRYNGKDNVRWVEGLIGAIYGACL
jgi:hypothetical protein